MARTKHPSHLYRRGDNFHFRCRVPNTQQLLRASLRTGDKLVALTLAAHLSLLVKQEIIKDAESLLAHRNRLVKDSRTDFEATRDDNRTEAPLIQSQKGPRRQKNRNLRLNQLIARFLDEAARLELWQEKHHKDMHNALKVCVEILGDIPINEFDLDKAISYRDGLIKYPYKRSTAKQFQGKSLVQIEKMQYKRISQTTVSNHLRKLSTFSNWLVDNGYIPKSPMVKIKVKKERSDKEAVRPFNQAELSRLFQSEIFTKKKYYLPYHYWLPLLGYYTGARIEELCQLYVDDLVVAEGHYCIRIDNKHEDQKLKTTNSRRLIPIHPHLIELGFWQFAQETQLLQGHTRLFPDLNKIGGKDGQYSHAASKWFGRYRKRVKVIENDTVFHSFRHGFIDQLREHGVDNYLIKRLVGHTGNGTTETIYGRQSPVTSTAKAISSLTKLELSRAK
ncbi:site-specific integrase [Photobacterium rosenbergii]|uniref:site-specific integrase n=1 Tax=Photobacterium rosenbergii TaxID=294936 RepID=UPI001C99BAED|nr:site-specific integrase [Photobacterium rosenbergii]MBY5948787.1 site-specific integrase [Photobacterium rosenbergii]